jgi:NTE family protein
MKHKYPIKNLVFKGGGIKAFAYIGALEAFEQHNILSQIERVAGNSAGSTMATLVSFRKTAKETSSILETLDYSNIASLVAEAELAEESHIPRALKEKGEQLKGGMGAINRLRQNYGLFSSEYIHNWLQEVIAQQCHGDGRATFADFQKLGFRDLHIVATNISTHTITEFSAVKTPNAAVADAAMASCSIPFFFEALQFDGEQFGQGDYYVDGGVLTNYPIRLFDTPDYINGNSNYDQGVNWETLGCRLYTPEKCGQEIEPITNLPGYVKNLVETLAITEDKTFEHSLIDQLRTINISNCCVGTTDFSVKPGTAKYDELLQAGRSATQEFLEDSRSPNDKAGDLRTKIGTYFKKD